MGVYRIAGNFRGRKLSRISEKDDFGGKNLRIACLCRSKDATPPNFAEKTFMNNHKTTKFAKVFSLENFPLYGIIHNTHIDSQLFCLQFQQVTFVQCPWSINGSLDCRFVLQSSCASLSCPGTVQMLLHSRTLYTACQSHLIHQCPLMCTFLVQDIQVWSQQSWVWKFHHSWRT